MTAYEWASEVALQQLARWQRCGCGNCKRRAQYWSGVEPEEPAYIKQDRLRKFTYIPGYNPFLPCPDCGYPMVGKGVTCPWCDSPIEEVS